MEKEKILRYIENLSIQGKEQALTQLMLYPVETYAYLLKEVETFNTLYPKM
jgi:hypothetical protein